MDSTSKNLILKRARSLGVIEKLRRKPESISILISFFIFGVGIYLQVKELFNRSGIGLGLTDEAFGILNAVDRGSNGQTLQTPLFADVTSILLSLASYDIQKMRFFGYIIIFTVLLLLWMRIISTQRLEQRKKSSSYFFLVAALLMLLIPASFRYLLVTPSYQWFVLVGSVVLVIVLSLYIKPGFAKNKFYLLPLCSFILFIVELSRLTSGFIIWILINIYLFCLKRIHEILIFNFSLFIINFMYLSMNYNAFVSSLLRLAEFRNIDPRGSNLIFEVLDVAQTSLTIFLIVIVSKSASHRISMTKDASRGIKITLRSRFVFQFLMLATLVLVFPYRDIDHLFALICIALIGALIGITNPKINYALLLLCNAPIISQFGSNISSSYLVVPMILCPALYLFLASPLRVEFDHTRPKASRLMQGPIFIFLSLCLVLLQVNLASTSYENGYLNQLVNRDPMSGLMYSNQKMNSIEQLRSDAKNYGRLDNQRILDLSYWHPGVIYYLGGLQFPLSTVDKAFANTLFHQVQITIKQLGPNGPDSLAPLIVKTVSDFPKLKCEKLINQINDLKLASALRSVEYNPYVREIAIYKSVKDDVTLYPFNISVMVPCTEADKA